jgi:two-component system chemotaxis response regulator CheY
MTMKRKILVVDDSATIRHQLIATLAAAGFDVIEAVDGIAGAETFEQSTDIAAVICDLNMPRMNGIDMVVRVKALPQHAKLAMIMLTTEGQGALLRRAEDAGAVGWIVKPFNPAQLVAVVKRVAA